MKFHRWCCHCVRVFQQFFFFQMCIVYGVYPIQNPSTFFSCVVFDRAARLELFILIKTCCTCRVFFNSYFFFVLSCFFFHNIILIVLKWNSKGKAAEGSDNAVASPFRRRCSFCRLLSRYCSIHHDANVSVRCRHTICVPRKQNNRCSFADHFMLSQFSRVRQWRRFYSCLLFVNYKWLNDYIRWNELKWRVHKI